MSQLSNFLAEQILMEESKIKKTVVVYVGRFQPMHKGHFKTFQHLQKKFGKKDVYIGTSNKTEKGRSPFNFKEKVKIMTTMFGIPKSKIVQVKNPYNPQEVLKRFNKETTAFVTVVGQKDASRLSHKYFQKYDGNPTEGYEDRGYLYVAPMQGGSVSGTEVRQGLSMGSDDQKEKFFKDRAYGKFNKTIFQMVTDKLSEGLFVPKETIEEYMMEISTGGLGGQDVDDGPNFFIPNYKTFRKVAADRAAKLGYTVVNMIGDEKFEDYYEHPEYPDGPQTAVSYFPAGVIGTMTPNNQVDIYSSGAYSNWYKHVTRKAAMVGYDVIKKLDVNKDDKDQSTDDAKGAKELEKEFESSLTEMIKLPVKVGDTILMGRFKNKKVVVKSIGKDEHGMPTINGKKVVTFRLMKEGFKVELQESCDRPMEGETEQQFRTRCFGINPLAQPPKGLMRVGEAKELLRVPSDIIKIQKGFKKNGKKLYVVGGAVRDAILGKSPKDFDLATDAKPDEVLKIAKDLGMKTVEVGKSFGVVMVGGHEIATFRKDIGKGRRPSSVDYTDIEGDVRRRDLTVNALFYDIDKKEIVDLVGGIADLKKKKIRTVGKAEERFEEDPLRKLRALRFQARLGGSLDKDLLNALQKDPSLKGVSSERIRDEFVKSLKSAKDTKKYMELCDKIGFTSLILPNLKINKPYIKDNDYILFLANLLRKNQPSVLAKTLNKLTYSNDERNNIVFLVTLDDFKPEEIVTYKKLQNKTSLSDDQIKKFGKSIGKDMGKFVKFNLSVGGKDVPKDIKGPQIGLWIKNKEKENFLGEDSNPNAHPQGKNKLTNRTTVMDMLDVISHKEFRKDYDKLSDSQKKKVLKVAKQQKFIKEDVDERSKGKLRPADLLRRKAAMAGKRAQIARRRARTMKRRKPLAKLKKIAYKKAYLQVYDEFMKDLFPGMKKKDLSIQQAKIVHKNVLRKKKRVQKRARFRFLPALRAKEADKFDGKEAARIPRKKGQHRNSSSHSDLYTDENPKGTIKGLKFATVDDAKKSVSKIKSSGKSHAHKIQAAVAMEQRAKEMGKKSQAAVYRAYINKMKKKTKAKNETLGYPSKEDMKKINQRLDNQRKNTDSNKEYQYHTIKENINESKLLMEGGAYGHMNHPFDSDVNLTFGQLKDIVNRALDGTLENTREKTDGQALAISWRDNRLVAARNKGHLKNKGENALDIKGVSDKFQGRGGLSDAYNFAMRDLSKAISSLSEKQREKVFKGGACFMNLEVIYPTSVNVVPYGQALLVFHGTMEYDEEGVAIGENQGAARVLAGMIKQVNQNVQSSYTIEGPPVVKLPKSQDLSKKKSVYNGKIKRLQKKYNLKDTDGVAEYHQAFWENYVDKKSPTTLDNKTKMGLVKRWAFFDKKFRLDSKNISDSKTLDWAKKTDKEKHSKIAKDNIRPFEDIFLGLGAEVLQFVSSALTVNPDSAIRDMKKRLDKTIKDVRKSGDVKKIQKLKLELQRLNSIGGAKKIVPNEGIVFTYNGKTFKLTGTFAPLNQILGIFF